MKNVRLLIFLLLTTTGCINVKSKKDYKDTTEVCDKLYVESYTLFNSGAYGGDLLSDYLTDSSNFRLFIGKYDDKKEIYNYECDAKRIIVKKVVRYPQDTTGAYLDRRVFNLDSLKSTHHFE